MTKKIDTPMKTYSELALIGLPVEAEGAFLAGSATDKPILIKDDLEVKPFTDEGTFEVSFD